MFIILEQGPAIFVLVLSTVLLGTYPAAFNFVELAGRKPAHTFLDFSAAFVITAVPTAIALSNSGPKSDFIPGLWEQLSQDNGFLVWCACSAGLMMMIGSVCLQFGIALTGLAISLPYQIAVSLSVGLGIDYFLDTRITRASWIFPGLFCFSLATIFGTFAHLARLKALRARREKGRVVLEDLLKGKPLSAAVDEPGVKAKARVITLPLDEGESSSAEASPAQQRKGTVLKSSLSTEAPDVILDLESPDHKSRRSSSIRLHGAQVMQDTNAFPRDYSAEPHTPKGHALASQSSIRSQYCQRGIETDAGSPWTGLAVISAGGVCFGLMSPFMFIATSALATTNGWRILPYGVPPLTAYNAFFLFALAFFFTAVGANLALLYRPAFACEASSVLEWALDRRGRAASLAAGVAAGAGMGLQFMGSLGGGFAVADLVKLYPLLSLAWGLTLFNEFRGLGRAAVGFLAAMSVAYVLGVGLLAGARNHPVVQ